MDTPAEEKNRGPTQAYSCKKVGWPGLPSLPSMVAMKKLPFSYQII